MSEPTPKIGDHFRGEPDDGRYRFTYDPAGVGDELPWRVDDYQPPTWAPRGALPEVLVPVSREEWLAWLAAL